MIECYSNTPLWISLVICAFGSGISVGAALVALLDSRRQPEETPSVPDGSKSDTASY